MAARIMVVNDTQEILELFRLLLEGEGYEVVLYSYALQEIAEVERVKPDLLIIDVIFGSEKLGWQLLDKLKMNKPTVSIPVIVCTAALDAVREMEGYLRAQGVSVVFKPFDIDAFVATVKLALESRNQIASLKNEKTDGDTQ